MNRPIIVSIAVLILVIGFGIATYMAFFRTDPEVAAAREVAKELIAEIESSDALPDRAKFENFANKVQSLPVEKRQEAMAPMREHMEAEVDRFFTLPAEEQTKMLDEHISRMEEMRKLAEEARARGESPPAPPGMRQNMTPEERKQMLDRTTPEQRAKMMQFMQRLMGRRMELGLSPLPFPGPPPG